jgi:hypothetical protein
VAPDVAWVYVWLVIQAVVLAPYRSSLLPCQSVRLKISRWPFFFAAATITSCWASAALHDGYAPLVAKHHTRTRLLGRRLAKNDWICPAVITWEP